MPEQVLDFKIRATDEASAIFARFKENAQKACLLYTSLERVVAESNGPRGEYAAAEITETEQRHADRGKR